MRSSQQQQDLLSKGPPLRGAAGRGAPPVLRPGRMARTLHPIQRGRCVARGGCGAEEARQMRMVMARYRHISVLTQHNTKRIVPYHKPAEFKNSGAVRGGLELHYSHTTVQTHAHTKNAAAAAISPRQRERRHRRGQTRPGADAAAAAAAATQPAASPSRLASPPLCAVCRPSRRPTTTTNQPNAIASSSLVKRVTTRTGSPRTRRRA